MLLKKLAQAKRNTQPQDSNFEDTYYEAEEKITGRKEEVLVGHNYIDDNSETDNTLGEGYPIADPESPNDLDADIDVCDAEGSNEEIESELSETSIKLSDYAEAIEELNSEDKKEESEVIACSDPFNKKEDTSGNTKSRCFDFLEKYADSSTPIQCLRRDLMSIMADFHWIMESENKNEQWALDFADALNELSVSL